MTKKLSILLIFTITILIGTVFSSETVDTADAKFVKDTITVLTSKEAAGRGTGQAGQKYAREFLLEKIKALGLKPLKTNNSTINGYLQTVPLAELVLNREGTYIEFVSSEKTVLKYGDDFVFRPISKGNLKIEGKPIFLGYGIDAPEFDYSDYNGKDVKGRIIIIMDGEPDLKDIKKFRGKLQSKYANWRDKINVAAKHGVGGVIFIVSKSSPRGDLWTRESGRDKRRFYNNIVLDYEANKRPPFLVINNENRDKLLGTERNLEAIVKKINNTGKPVSFEIETTIKMNLVNEKVREFEEYNILGVLEGASPKLKNEYIFAGAHYDHQGTLADESYYPGADDNASGVTASLLSIKKLSESKNKLERSVLITFWTAEERGLLGSEYFILNRSKDLHMVAYLNSDMVGRNHMNKDENSDFLMLFHCTQSPILTDILQSAAKEAGLKVRVTKSDTMGGGGGGSDHLHFHNAMVPNVFFFSGIHPDYEKQTDTPDKLNYEKVEKVGKMISKTLFLIDKKREKVIFDNGIKDDPSKKPGRPF